jgi:mono/diheme cytochrome c family protein
MPWLTTLVRVVQVITAIVTASFVILLFANEPPDTTPVPSAAADSGQAIFETRCARCHGTDGAGGFGPALAGVVVEAFPDPADQEAVVANGRGSMPAFDDTLTPEQISAVVEYTRTGLG